MQVFAHFFCRAKYNFAIIKEPVDTTWSMQPLENGRSQRPLPSASPSGYHCFYGAHTHVSKT